MTKSTKWLDIGTILVSLVVIGVSAFWMMQGDVFSFKLYNDEKLVWHLVRSTGMVSYMLLLASTIWGLFISSQFAKNWSPGIVSITLHSTVSWLALLLGLGHGLLLRFDDYFTYTYGDIFIPFTGPYRPVFVGLGTLAFWLIVIVSLSFPLKKFIGFKTWKRLHYVSYAAFGMVSMHGLFAGTDGNLMGFRLLVGMGVAAVVFLLGFRLNKSPRGSAKKPVRQTVQQTSG